MISCFFTKVNYFLQFFQWGYKANSNERLRVIKLSDILFFGGIFMIQFKKKLMREDEQELRRLGLSMLQVECIKRLAKRGGSMQEVRKIIRRADFNTLFEVANVIELYKINQNLKCL